MKSKIFLKISKSVVCVIRTTPWHAKDRFSGFRRRVVSWGPSRKLQNFITYHLPYNRRRYMAAILWIQCKTIDQSIVCIKYIFNMNCYANVTEIFVSHKVGVWSGFSFTRTNTLTNYKQEAMKILFRFWTMVSLYFRCCGH